MKKTFFLLFLVYQFALAFSQVDSTLIKLQQYKSFYNVGLIDSEEYVALKKKLLGLNQPSAPEQKPEVIKAKTVDRELFYDVTKGNQILPQGVYMSIEEIKTKNPSLKCNLTLETIPAISSKH